MDTLLIHFKQLFLLVSIKTCWGGLIIEMGHFVTHWRCCDGFLTWKDDDDNGDDILDISLQMGSAVISCDCVSSGGVFILCPRARDGETGSVREGRGWYRHRCNLRDSEELFFFLVLWLWITSPRLNSWPFPLLSLTPSLPTPTILCFVAWINIVLYLLHINSSYVSSWQNNIKVALGLFWLHTFSFWSLYFSSQ